MGLSQGPGHRQQDPDRARRWRALVHRHGSNLLGGVMVTVMLYAVVLTVLAS
jgi:hypothetical protein